MLSVCVYQTDISDLLSSQSEDASTDYLLSLLTLLTKLNKVISEEMERFQSEKNTSQTDSRRHPSNTAPSLSPDVLSIG